MANDILSRTASEFGGALSADGAKVVFAAPELGTDGLGLLVQQVSVNYQQNISRIYEVGSDRSYYVAGRAQGTASINRVVGPRVIQLGFYSKFGNVCNAAENNIDFIASNACGPGGTAESVAFTLKHVVLVGIGMTVGAQDMVINEAVSMMYTALTAGTGAG
jgi:hypothetical protein